MTKKQRKFSIKNKILALVLGCSVLALLLYSTVSLTVNYRATMENSKKYSNDMLNQLSISITTYLSAIDNQVFSCLFNSLTQQHLRLLYSHKDNSVYTADSSQYIQNLLYIMSTSLEDCSFHLFMENGSNQSFHVNNPSSMISAWYDFHEDDWYQQVQKVPRRQSKTMASLQRQSYYNSTLEGVVIIYRIVNANNLSTMGYLLVDIPKSNLAELVAKNLNNNFSILILSENNEVLYDSTGGIGAEITGEGVSAEWEKVYRTSRGSYSAFRRQVDFTKWILIGIIPYNYHLQGFFDFLNVSLICALIICILFAIVAIRLSYTITRPLKELASGMTEVQKGNFGKTIPNHSSDETALLIDHFNAMTLQIEELTQKKQMAEILYKDAQIAMLQGQINPHFLYNTLEMIKGIAQGESAPVVRSCCNALSKIFRYNLKGAEVVPLAVDLDQAKAYIHIMELRFEDVFAVAYDIDETVLTHKSVKFTFQPFLENAIVHGFANKLRGGLLTVDVHRAGDAKIRITITDNGCGIEPEKLESIRAMLEQKEKGSDGSQNIANHIGIGNTHMRLYNWFGKDYSLQMESKTGEGTRVIITIPAV